MRKLAVAAAAILALGALVGVVALLSVVRRGLSARDAPTGVETFVSRSVRRLGVPRTARQETSPVASSPEVLARGRAHFADHCATCHGNDGRGRTALGQNLYPRAPDMTQATQRLTDGEIAYVIENGIRLSGMPAWGRDEAHDRTESWELVAFIRHLPKITERELTEMEALNPRSPRESAEELAIRKFLAGEADAPPVEEEGHGQ